MQDTSKEGSLHLLSAQKVLFASLKRNDLLVALALMSQTVAGTRTADIELSELAMLTGVSYARVRRAVALLCAEGWLSVQRHGGQGSTYTWSAERFEGAVRRVAASSASVGRAPSAFRRHDLAYGGMRTSLLRDANSPANSALNDGDRVIVETISRELARAKATRMRVPSVAPESLSCERGAQLAAWVREQCEAYQLPATRVTAIAATAYLKESGKVAEANHPLSWMIYSSASLSVAIARAAAPRGLDELVAPSVARTTPEGFGAGANDVLAAIGGAR